MLEGAVFAGNVMWNPTINEFAGALRIVAPSPWDSRIICFWIAYLVIFLNFTLSLVMGDPCPANYQFSFYDGWSSFS